MTEEELKECESWVEAHKYEQGLTNGYLYVARLIAHIRTEQRREAELERIAREYGLCSKAVNLWAFVWMTIHDTSNDTTGIGMSTSTFPTRRACDNAILTAVAAYEREGGK